MGGIPYDFFQLMDKKTEFIVLGDTDSMFINVPSVKPKTTEDAIEIANKIAKGINDSITYFNNNELLPKLGIDTKYNFTEFKTEIVANGLLLLAAKKNYACRMLAKEGKVIDPAIITYTGIGVKSDQTKWTKDFIRTLTEDIILNPEISRENAWIQISQLAEQAKNKIQTDLDNYEYHYIGIPKKWGTKFKDPTKDAWQIIAMKLFNTIMNEKILVPMSPSLVLPINIPTPQDFERKLASLRNTNDSFISDTPISKMSYIAFPHTYDKDKVKKAMDYFGINISAKDVWDKICNSTIKDIIGLFKNNNNPIIGK